MTRHLIVNADDLGLTKGVNRAILDCHLGGVVTSASLMVERPAAAEAAALARRHPSLSVGLHWDPAGLQAASPTPGRSEVEADLEGQLERFRELVGRDPTHLDSHWHAHREPPADGAFRELGARLGVPVRGQGDVAYIGGFYAQWEWKVTELEYVSVEFLCRLLHEEVSGAWTEIGCHPGYVDAALDSVYLHEREAEVRTLTDPRVRAEIERLDIRLIGFRDLPTSAGGAR